jgi:hypothetical protein
VANSAENISLLLKVRLAQELFFQKLHNRKNWLYASIELGPVFELIEKHIKGTVSRDSVLSYGLRVVGEA